MDFQSMLLSFLTIAFIAWAGVVFMLGRAAQALANEALVLIAATQAEVKAQTDRLGRLETQLREVERILRSNPLQGRVISD